MVLYSIAVEHVTSQLRGLIALARREPEVSAETIQLSRGSEYVSDCGRSRNGCSMNQPSRSTASGARPINSQLNDRTSIGADVHTFRSQIGFAKAATGVTEFGRRLAANPVAQ
jgi:hypothetical protein